MEIDLREIQDLHARYARVPVTIDLEAQVRSRPAPLLLAHDAALRPSGVRRVWDARGKMGRSALMVIGGTVVCAAIGMGAAKLYASTRSAPHIQPQHAGAAGPAASTVTPGPASVSPASDANALTQGDFERSSARASGLTAVDPSELTHHAATLASTSSSRAGPTPTATVAATDEQRAAASPIRQHSVERPSTLTVSQPASASAATSAAADAHATATGNRSPVPDAPARVGSGSLSPASATQLARHTVHRSLSTGHEQQQSNADGKTVQMKPLAAATRGGDVQLF